MEKIYTLTDLPLIAQILLQQYKHYKIWAFFAPMGSGKTTLIRTILHELGITTRATSPTFNLIHEYNQEAIYCYHYDFYRLENSRQAVVLGVEEQWESGSFCLLEWAEHVVDILPKPRIDIHLSVLSELQRKIKVYEMV
jgi:tRNA threonylcarbamoyladenosine biosynthesis protein TsaE